MNELPKYEHQGQQIVHTQQVQNKEACVFEAANDATRPQKQEKLPADWHPCSVKYKVPQHHEVHDQCGCKANCRGDTLGNCKQFMQCRRGTQE